MSLLPDGDWVLTHVRAPKYDVILAVSRDLRGDVDPGTPIEDHGLPPTPTRSKAWDGAVDGGAWIFVGRRREDWCCDDHYHVEWTGAWRRPTGQELRYALIPLDVWTGTEAAHSWVESSGAWECANCHEESGEPSPVGPCWPQGRPR